MALGLVCKELVELVTEYLDGTLPRRTRKRVEKHLSVCHDCRAHLEQMHFAIRATGMLTEESLSESGVGRDGESGPAEPANASAAAQASSL